jgi:CHU_C Type IX secretion signal domain
VYPIPTMTVCCNTKILLGEDTVITATATGTTDIKLYQWWNPTNSTLNYDTGRTVIATPTVTTTYTVTGTDADGCQVTRTVTIVIDVPCEFVVPNVFTPTYGGVLGVDNKLYINSPNANSWNMVIYDRWGVEMYRSTDPFQYWNGSTESGNGAPAGVYYYQINGSCQGGIFKKYGFVQLIR